MRTGQSELSRGRLTLIRLVIETLQNPHFTQEYNSAKGIVNVLDGWTVPIALQLANPSDDEVTDEIVRRLYDGPDLVIESVDIGVDVVSSLLAALDSFKVHEIKTRPITDSSEQVGISLRTAQTVQIDFGVIEHLFHLVKSRRYRHRTLVLPTSFPFFVNRFAVLRRPNLPNDTKLEVLMQLFLYWRVVAAREPVAREQLYSSRAWCNWIERHRGDDVYGERSFRDMSNWWSNHIEAQVSTLGHSMALHCFSGTVVDVNRDALFVKRFCFMVEAIGEFFDEIAGDLGLPLSRRPRANTPGAGSSDAVLGSSSDLFKPVARPRREKCADNLQDRPVVLDY